MAGAGIHPYHQQWPPTGAPPPPSAVSSAPPPHPPPVHHHHPPPPGLADRPPYDELRTIFIAGLPDDVKERELLNLLRWLPGYEASQVNFKGEKPMGFALFSTAQFALAARDALQHLVFDAESKSVLHAEMAKKNLFVKRGIVGDSNAYDQSKRLRTGGGDCTHSVYSPSPFHPPPPQVWGPPHGYLSPAAPPYDPYGGYHAPPVPMPPSAPIAAPSSYVPVQGRRVFIIPTTKPGLNTIMTLVKAVHGQPVERLGRSFLSEDKVPENLLVLSCEEDQDISIPFLERGAEEVYSSELLLNGIVTQKLE